MKNPVAQLPVGVVIVLFTFGICCAQTTTFVESHAKREAAQEAAHERAQAVANAKAEAAHNTFKVGLASDCVSCAVLAARIAQNTRYREECINPVQQCTCAKFTYVSKEPIWFRRIVFNRPGLQAGDWSAPRSLGLDAYSNRVASFKSPNVLVQGDSVSFCHLDGGLGAVQTVEIDTSLNQEGTQKQSLVCNLEEEKCISHQGDLDGGPERASIGNAEDLDSIPVGVPVDDLYSVTDYVGVYAGLTVRSELLGGVHKGRMVHVIAKVRNSLEIRMHNGLLGFISANRAERISDWAGSIPARNGSP